MSDRAIRLRWTTAMLLGLLGVTGCRAVSPVGTGVSGPTLVLPWVETEVAAAEVSPTNRQSSSVAHAGEVNAVPSPLPGVAWGRGGGKAPIPLKPEPVATPVPTGPFFPSTVSIEDIAAELAALPAGEGTGAIVGEDGKTVNVAAGAAVAMPTGASGTVTALFAGTVPATLALGMGGVPVLHPRSTVVPALPAGRVTMTGVVSPPVADVQVRFVAPGRRDMPTATTAADGSYSLEVPADGPVDGVLVAEEVAAPGRLAVASVTVSEGTGAPVLALVSPRETIDPLPSGPSGFYLAESALAASMPTRPLPWRVPLTTVRGGRVASYAMSGVSLVETYLGRSADGSAGTLTGGTPGKVPPFMAPPDLSGLVEALTPGTALSWPAVPGATLYTIALMAGDRPVPVWEGATAGTQLTIPAAVSLPEETLTLQVTAWDAPDVTLYSIASVPAARQLRVPAEPQGQGGRMSWATRVYPVVVREP